MMNVLFFLLWMSAGFALGIIFGSFFEWTLHRFVMHRKFLGKFDYSFKRHTLTHHHVFKADETYHLICEKDKLTVPMAWWNGPVLIAICELPFALVGLLIGNLALVLGTLLAICVYYAAYEYLHWCMHIPKKRKLERSGIFSLLNTHHLLHHRYMHRNFNVVLPIADFCLGTLLLRSKLHFASAQQPARSAKRRKYEPRCSTH